MGRPFTTALGLGCLLLAGMAQAQVAISARSGLINYVEGTVFLDGATITMKPGKATPVPTIEFACLYRRDDESPILAAILDMTRKFRPSYGE